MASNLPLTGRVYAVGHTDRWQEQRELTPSSRSSGEIHHPSGTDTEGIQVQEEGGGFQCGAVEPLESSSLNTDL